MISKPEEFQDEYAS